MTFLKTITDVMRNSNSTTLIKPNVEINGHPIFSQSSQETKTKANGVLNIAQWTSKYYD